MIIDINNVVNFEELKKMMPGTIMDVVGPKGILVISSDDVEFKGLGAGKVIGYLGSDRPNTYIDVSKSSPEFIGNIGEDERTLFEVEPTLFGYKITEYIVNGIFVYEIDKEDYKFYNISNIRLNIRDVG